MPVQQAQTMQQPQSLPLIQQADNRDASTKFDAKLVNGYAEQDRLTGNWQVYKRPGVSYTYSLTATNGNGQGLFSWHGTGGFGVTPYNVYAVHGSTLYRNGTSVGSVSAANSLINRFSFVVLATPSQSTLILNNGGGTALYTCNASSGAGLAQVSPVGATILVPGIATVDGTTYIMDVYGGIWGSEINEPVWSDVTNLVYANSEPSLPVFITRQLSYVIAFKENSTQVFADNGNPTGSPLINMPESMLPYGCASAQGVQSIDDILLWPTFNLSRSPQVAMMANLRAKIVSTPAIDRLLKAAFMNPLFVDYQQVYSASFKFGGHRFYLLTLVNSNLTLVYDIDQNLWMQWTDYQGNYFPYMESGFDENGNILTQNISINAIGAINYIDAAYVYPNDLYVAGLRYVVPVDIYTPNFDGGINRTKTLNRLWIQADQTPGSLLYSRYSDNDYRTWSNFRQIDLSRSRPFLRDEGSFYKRAYHFRHFANTPLRIRAVDLEYDIGTT